MFTSRWALFLISFLFMLLPAKAADDIFGHIPFSLSLSSGQAVRRNAANNAFEAFTPTVVTPGGSNTQVQFNDGGVFGGDSAFTFDKTNKSLLAGAGIEIKKAGTDFVGINFSPNNATVGTMLRSYLGSPGFFPVNAFSFYSQGSTTTDFVIGQNTTGVSASSGAPLGWRSGFRDEAIDTAFSRNAPGVVEINNGTTGTYRDLILRNLTVTGTCTGCGGGGGTPGGSDTQVQFNDSGAFGGDSGFTYTKGTKSLAVGGASSKMTLAGPSSAGAANVGLELDPGGAGAANTTFDIGTRGPLQAIRMFPGGGTFGNGPAFQLWPDGTTNQGMYYDAGNVSGSDIHFRQSSWPTPSDALTIKQGTGTLMIGTGSDTGLNRNTIGVLEINNGTAGQYRDLYARNITLQSSGVITGSGAVPTGGTTGQILKKNSNTNYDYAWSAGASSANPTAQVSLSAVNGSAGTFMTSDSAPALDQSIAPTWTGQHAWKFSDAATNTVTNVLTIGHNSSGTPAANFGTGLAFQAKDSTTADQSLAGLSAYWSVATHGSVQSNLDFKVVAANALSTGMSLKGSGSSGISALDFPSGGSGITFADAGTSGKFIQGNGTRYLPSAYTFPTGLAGSNGKILQESGGNIIESTPTWPTAAGTAGNVVTSDGTNFVSLPQSGGNWTGKGNTDYTILSTDRYVYTNAAFTASHIWTLPAASAIPAGQSITVIDLQGTVTAANFLQVTRAGSDTIWPQNTSSTQLTIAGQGVTLVSDGSSKWYATAVQPGKGNTGSFVQFPASGNSAWQVSPFALPTAVGSSGKVMQSDGSNIVMSTPTWPTASGTSGYNVKSDGTNFVSYPEALFNSNTAAQSSTFNADTYITNSNVTVAAGDWKAKGVYRCRFDMSKTGGTAAPVLSVRIGTNASTADTAILTFTLGAGTAVSDTSVWDLTVNFRSVGSGSTAVVQGLLVVQHTAATGTGITSTADKSLTPFTLATSVGFNSTTATQLGCSFNGGTSFGGTLQQVTAALVQP